MYVYAGGAAAPDYLEAARGHGEAAGNSGMHQYMRMHLSALAPARSRAGHGGRHLISALFGGGACCGAKCGWRGAPAGCS